MPELSHADLVRRGAYWLFTRKKKRCSVVVTEIASNAFEEPDVLGWYGGAAILLECKATRRDFLGDFKKRHRHASEQGVGYYRSYFVPKGLVAVKELPKRWGLIEVSGRRVRIVRNSMPFYKRNQIGESAILLSCLKRIGSNAPKSMSVRFYTTKTKCRTTLGITKGEQFPQTHPYTSFSSVM